MKQTPPLVGLGVIPWDSIPLVWNLGLVIYFFFLESFCITILTLVLIIVTSCLAGSAAISAKDLKIFLLVGQIYSWIDVGVGQND